MRKLFLFSLLLLGASLSAQVPVYGNGITYTYNDPGAGSACAAGSQNVQVISTGVLYACPSTGLRQIIGGGTGTITSPDSTISVGGTSGAITLDLNLAHANTYTAAQTFANGTLASPGIAMNAAGWYSPSAYNWAFSSSGNEVFGLGANYATLLSSGGSVNSRLIFEPDTSTCNVSLSYASAGVIQVGDCNRDANGSIAAASFIGTVATGSGATPAIAAGTRDFTITMSVSATATISGIVAGTDLNVEVCQPAGQSYVFTFPTAMHGVTSTTPTAGDCNTFHYHSFNGSTMELMASQTGLLP